MLVTLSVLANAQVTGIKINGDTCTSQTLDLQVTGTSSSPYFFWNFGDPLSGTNDTVTITGSSASPFPTHTFTSPGVYNVCVSFQEPGSPVPTICRSISIGLCCGGNIQTNDSCLQRSIPFSLNTAATINTITWDFGDPATGVNNFSNLLNPSHTFSGVGTYAVTATVNAACGTFESTTLKSVVSCAQPPACTGAIVFTDSCKNARSRFRVTSVYPVNAIRWNFGDAASGPDNNADLPAPTHTFAGEDSYVVTAIVNLSCGTDTITTTISILPCDSNVSSNCGFYVPNAFTPNNDNLNDYFYPVPLSNCVLSKYSLSIFNRWGELVFQSTSPYGKWDGKFKNQDCPVGTYFYFLKYSFSGQNEETKKGDIEMLW